MYAVVVERARADRSPAGSGQAPGESGARPRILLVEDDLTIRQMTQLALERDGFAVTTAHDGASGLAAFRVAAARSGHPRRDAAGRGRRERVPHDPRAERRADRDADRQNRSRSTSCWGSRRAPTTTSPSRSSRRSWRPGCGPCCAGSPAMTHRRVLRVGELEIDRDGMEVRVAGRAVEPHPDRVPAAARAGRAQRRGPAAASACSRRCGATSGRATHGWSTCTCAGCGRRSAPETIETVRGAGYKLVKG